MTLADVIEILRADPELYLAVKDKLVKDGRVAGAWEYYDDSGESKRKNTMNNSWVRFSPSELAERVSHESAVVVSVRRRARPSEPDRWTDYYREGRGDEYLVDHAEWKKEVAQWEVHSWCWLIRALPGAALARGAAETREEAMAAADAELRRRGWTLVNPPLVRLAEVAEEG